MTFGPHGFFGYAPSSPLANGDSPEDFSEKRIMWWSTYETDPAPGRNLPLKDLRTQLLERHGLWRSPYDSANMQVFPSIIQLACGAEEGERSMTAADRDLLILPTYLTPRLPRWCTPSGKIMLLGDSAHAMPPHAGQGVSAAVEDSVAIALLLKHYLAQRPTSTTTGELDVAEILPRVAKGYQDIRMPRLGGILDKARRLGDTKRTLSPWQERFRDWIMWILCQLHSILVMTKCRLTPSLSFLSGKLPESVMNKELYAYNVDVEVQKYLRKLSS